jgi:hypothetical protein
MYCGTKTDSEGNPLSKYPALEEANRRASKIIADALEAIEDRNAFEHLDGKCPCKKHRTYKAIRKPTSGCEECWRFYIRMHP